MEFAFFSFHTVCSAFVSSRGLCRIFVQRTMNITNDCFYLDALFALQATIPPQRCGGMRGEGRGVGQSNEMHDLLGDKRT